MCISFYRIDKLNKLNKPILNHCGKETSILVNSTSINKNPDFSISNCHVVLEDISVSKVTVKSQTLKLCPDKTHMTTSRCFSDENTLLSLEPKTPIAWPNMTDDRWGILDSAVASKLYRSSNIFDRLQLLEITIYFEAAKLFGHRQVHP